MYINHLTLNTGHLARTSRAAEWLGDLERCIALAWITRNPDLGAVA